MIVTDEEDLTDPPVQKNHSVSSGNSLSRILNNDTPPSSPSNSISVDAPDRIAMGQKRKRKEENASTVEQGFFVRLK